MEHMNHSQKLNPYRFNSKLGMSIMKKTMLDILPSNKTLEDCVYPYELCSSFQDEMDFQIRSKIKTIVQIMYPREFGPSNLLVNVGGSFAKYIGVELGTETGWNIFGTQIAKKVDIEISKPRVYKIIQKLFGHFYKFFSIEEFSGFTLLELEKKLKDTEEKTMALELLFDIYEQEYRCRGTLVYYMQKRLTFRTKIWVERGIIRNIQEDLCKASSLPMIDDVDCGREIMERYWRNDFFLSHRTKQKLESFHTKEYTLSEIKLFSEYIPRYKTCLYYFLDQHSEYHPQYSKHVEIDGREFPCLLCYIHYEILRMFFDDNRAYEECFYLETEKDWEILFQQRFQESFYYNVYKASEDAQFRLDLLNIPKGKISCCIEFDIFELENTYGIILDEIRTEMQKSLPEENNVEYQTIMNCLEIWYNCFIPYRLEEKQILRGFFKIFFKIQPKEVVLSTGKIFSISLQDGSLHGLLESCFDQIDVSLSLKIDVEQFAKDFQKYILSNMVDTSWDFDMLKLKYIVKKFKNDFSLSVDTVPDFPDQTYMNWNEYCIVSRLLS